MLEYSLTVRGMYSDISDADLEKKNFLAGEIINYMDICSIVAFKFGFSVFTTPNIEWIQKGQSCVNCAICRRESRYICLIYVSKGKGVLQDWASNGAHGNTN